MIKLITLKTKENLSLKLNRMSHNLKQILVKIKLNQKNPFLMKNQLIPTLQLRKYSRQNTEQLNLNSMLRRTILSSNHSTKPKSKLALRL